jgi:hypothetical protein
MKYHFKILCNDVLIPFDEAVQNKYIILTPEGFIIQDCCVKIYIFSGLYDANNNEIYENDLLKDDNGKEYIVNYLLGTFFIKEMNGNKGCIPYTLSSIKFGNKIDSMYLIS